MSPRTPEGRVKERVKKILHSLNAYYTMPQTGGYGASGVPDFLICFAGRFFAVECKAGKKEPTDLQMRQLMNIIDAGGYVFLVNETPYHSADHFELKLIFYVLNY